MMQNNAGESLVFKHLGGKSGHFMIFLATAVLLGRIELWSGSPSSLMHLSMKDRVGREFVLTFGTDPKATDGFDETLGEVPIPPLPPPGNFELRFLDPPGHPRVPSDGTYTDVRPPYSSTQTDTFIVHFQTSSEGYPVVFSWERSNYSDSMFVQYRIEDSIRRVNMRTQSSLVLNETAESKLMIILYGSR